MTPTKSLTELIEEKARKYCERHPDASQPPGSDYYFDQDRNRASYKDGATFALTPEVLIKVPEVRALVDALKRQREYKAALNAPSEAITLAECREIGVFADTNMHEALAPWSKYMEGEGHDS